MCDEGGRGRSGKVSGQRTTKCRTMSEVRSLSLELKLGTTPMTSLRVVSDGVVRLQANPLGDRAILLHLLGQTALESVRFVSRLCVRGWTGVIVKR